MSRAQQPAAPLYEPRVHTDVFMQIIESIQARQDYAAGNGRLGIRCHVKHVLANPMSCGVMDEFGVRPIVTIGVTHESLAAQRSDSWCCDVLMWDHES